MTTAPYGTWTSPITIDLAARGSRPLTALGTDPSRDDGAVYWLEGVPAEGGRMTLRRSVDGVVSELTPAPFNVRSRVHEYGGGAALVVDGIAYFSNFADGHVHRRHRDGRIAALTRDGSQRYADFALDRAHRRLIGVNEDHRDPATEPRNRLVAIDLDLDATPDDRASVVELWAGSDFVAAPRVSPDGKRLAWIAWSHPQMPWDGSMLWVAMLTPDGLRDARCVAGGPRESLCQPRWSPRGVLHVVSDRSGWWNLYRVDEDDRLIALCAMAAEFGEPAWQLAQSMYDFEADGGLVAIRIQEGVHRLARIDTAGHLRDVPTTLGYLDDLHVGGGRAIALGGSDREPLSVVDIDLASGRHTALVRSFEVALPPDTFSTPRRVRYVNRAGATIHAVYYPPRNAAFDGPSDERPPLIVQGHGGPTSMTNTTLRLGNQFWTSRGFAILDVDYTGSTGHGRAYREALEGFWGEADVADLVDGARFVADAGLADPARMAIRGASASGYAVLCALVFEDVFAAGVSSYGVVDLASLFAETHKFESRYGQSLVGDPTGTAARVTDRSPLHHVDRIDAPVLFFQGSDDRVVPPSQSRAMYASLRARGIPAAYVEFAGEGHGFRRFETLARVLATELAFYAQVFGFDPADVVAPVDLASPPTFAGAPP